jgi:hypothetical protein
MFDAEVHRVPVAMGQKQPSHTQSSDIRLVRETAGSSSLRAPIPRTPATPLFGMKQQRDEFQFGSKNQSAKTNALTEAFAIDLCLGAFHEENLGAGTALVRSSFKQCRFFARKASSGAKRRADGVRRNLQFG